MTLQLSQEDEKIIAELRRTKVLKNVSAKKMSAPRGFMAFVCSDCDHIRDKFEFLCGLCKVEAGNERVHLFSCHSGGLLLSPDSPTKKHPIEHEIYRAHVGDAMQLKGLDLLVSKCHAPCGAAYAQGLNFYDILRHIFLGKKYIKDSLPNLRVAVFAHVAHTDGRKLTYSVEGKVWWEYARQHNLFQGTVEPKAA